MSKLKVVFCRIIEKARGYYVEYETRKTIETFAEFGKNSKIGCFFD